MVKSCREINEEILALKRKLKHDKLLRKSKDYFSERRKCESNNVNESCASCDCWKSVVEKRT